MDDISIKIPKGALEGVVDAHVRAAVMEALGRDPAALVEKVVDAAMTEKAQHYNKRTLFQEIVAKEIRETARIVFGEWLEEQRPMIAARIRDHLNKKVKGKGFADRMVDALTQSMVVNVNLKDY